MDFNRRHSTAAKTNVSYAKRLYDFLAPRAYSAIILGALFCTLAVKLFQSLRLSRLSEYPGWIFSDIAVLLGIDIVLSAVCFFRARRWVIRSATIFAAVLCTWSVMNAGWLIRTGTQILPTVLLPLFRDPLNSLGIIGANLIEMPAAAILLLAPSAAALAFFFVVLARPVPPPYSRLSVTNRSFDTPTGFLRRLTKSSRPWAWRIRPFSASSATTGKDSANTVLWPMSESALRRPWGFRGLCVHLTCSGPAEKLPRRSAR